MPVLPQGSTLTFIASGASSTLVIADIQYTVTYEFFDRVEFTHEKQRTAKETTGVLPIFVTKLGGGIAQLSFTCSSTTPRPVTPDDSDINNIKKRFDINRWTIRGIDSLATNVDNVYQVWLQHHELYTQYQARLAQAQMDLSITDLLALQSNSTPFTNLVSTGFTVSGNTLPNSPLTNCLIANFEIDVAKEIPLNSTDTTFTLYKSWSMTLEQRQYLPANY